jgi:indole-3-glycerol phosphate synthase
MTAAASPDLLSTIVAAARRIVSARERTRSYRELDSAACRRRPRGAAFRHALVAGGVPRIVAECKRRSPSRGVLREQYDPARLGRGYEAAGAVAVSVLTEPTFFDGALDHLWKVRAATAVPILRKDFVVSPYQVLEARECGADAILLIVAALDDTELTSLVEFAHKQGLAALVEVHDEVELERALRAGATTVGVNSRDLKTLTVDLDVARRLAECLPSTVVGVAESGLKTREEIDELSDRGYQAFLMGERFMTAPDPGEALARFRAGGNTSSEG